MEQSINLDKKRVKLNKLKKTAYEAVFFYVKVYYK